MKKLVLSIAVVLGGVALASAQGTVKFYNISSLYLVSTNGTGYTPGNNGDTSGHVATSSVAPNGYYYALLISAAGNANGNPLTGGWSLGTSSSGTVNLIGNNYSLAGSLSGPGAANGVAVDGWAAGATMSVEIAGWSASLGTTWAQITAQLNSGNWNAAGYYGVSGIGQVASGGVGSPASPAAAIFGGTGIPSGWNLNGVSPIPEPATFALAGLGAAALLAFRRRKV